ncbi:PorT family protein [Hymenobacter sp. 5516J-16]|uniref:porin family protein n=1 Tax=Hymenobacter sp. 5516J-16 TaxID=2932253 RepID=UPI001FD1FBF5|nr:porin family protein [Hymenobacter sp. 5516J-16]UOQ75814.1 PorT family protein [Hymenobacter sp. 5516J-16]
MKKIFFSLALVAGVGGLVQAQSVQVGVKAGANLATVVGDDASDANESKVGLNAGVAFRFGLDAENQVALQPELLYSVKGTRSQDGKNKSDLTLHSLDIPVLLRLDAKGPFFELGPQLGFLLAVRSELSDGSSSVVGRNKDAYNKVSLGAVAGVGYQFSSGPSVGIRYNRDFSSVYEKIQGTQAQHFNSVFQFQLGYIFGR